MEERKNVDFWDWLKAVPEIPRLDTNSYYSAPCPCGGTIDAMEIGMSALRQRIHKEVIYGKTRSRDGKVIRHHAIATCPECYKTIAEWYDSWEAPYCSGCGQALSWKEKKDE